VLIGVATIVVLAAVWALIVVLQLRATWPQLRAVRAQPVRGWFGIAPSTPAGAITARSFAYWIRDPRYRMVAVMLPAIPVLTLLALSVGGVSFSTSVLVPLPMMVLLLAWSTSHNDVAYDHTAIWQHLASDVRGVHDRVGRLWPPLVFGAILVAIGAPLTAWGYGDWSVLPAVLGVNAAVLLGSVGVGSGLSARFPYAAPRPGDGAFRYPQVAGGSGGGAQGLSVFLVLLSTLPALAASALWLMGFPGGWNWIALLAGLVVGGATLVLGVLGGGRSFDRRGPELLAFTMRN
jgi:ABC-2 type transport system permease protein